MSVNQVARLLFLRSHSGSSSGLWFPRNSDDASAQDCFRAVTVSAVPMVLASGADAGRFRKIGRECGEVDRDFHSTAHSLGPDAHGSGP